MWDIYCPFCHTEFEGELWIPGECPVCKEYYYFDEEYIESLQDSFITVEWDRLDKPRKEIIDG